MSEHVPLDLLQSFVDGEVSEHVAIHVAEHLDSCPACATRAAGLEPLAAAFAAIEDPVPPEGLAASVMERMQRPERFPTMEIAVGTILLAAAALLTVGLQSPVALAADFGAGIHAADAMSRGMVSAVGSSQLVLVACAVLATGSGILTWAVARGRLPGLDRLGWGEPPGRSS